MPSSNARLTLPAPQPWRGRITVGLLASLLILGACGGQDSANTAGEQAVSASPNAGSATADASTGDATTPTGATPKAASAARTSTSDLTATAPQGCIDFYASRPSFALDGGRDVDPIATIAKPARGTVVEEPAYGTCLIRMTDHAADFAHLDAYRPVFVRTDYSRRQAWNADGSMTVVNDSTGFWHVYDGRTGRPIKRLNGLAADAEPQWDPVNPDKLTFLPPYGMGATVHELTISTNTSVVIGDLKARLAAIWPGADQAYTGAEGSPSRDGRYYCLMVRANEGNTQRSLGMITWDRVTDTILGSKSLDGQRPDYVTMSPSGQYCVMSMVAGEGQTEKTVAYSRDFSQSRLIHNRIEHSDLAIAANGDDVFVSIDYGASDGAMFMVNLVTGQRTDLGATYVPGGGVATAMHFSGKAFDKPGWVLVSAYDTGGGARQWMHRKIFALKLDATAEIRNLAFHRSVYNGYWTEPHATVSRDFTRVMFNTNWGSGSAEDVDAYQITLPAGVLDRPGRNVDPLSPLSPSTPTTPTSPTGPTSPSTAQPLPVAVSVATLTGYEARVSLATGRAADCRLATTAGNVYGALYDDLTPSTNGLNHDKTFAVGSPTRTTVWAVCRARDDGSEKEVTMVLDPDAPTPFTVSVSESAMSGYEARYRLTTNEPATCRGANTAGNPFGALTETITRSADGLTHDRTLTLGMPVATTVYAVCRADASGTEREVAIALAPATNGGDSSSVLTLTLRDARRDGYAASFTIESSTASRCRTTWYPGYSYDALSEDLTRSADGRTHSKSLTLGLPASKTVYAVCRSDTGSLNAEIAVTLP